MKTNYPSFIFLFLFVFAIGVSELQAQIGVGTDFPDKSSILDVTSTNKGMLVPRLTTTQRLAITTPAHSLMVYDTDVDLFYYFNTKNSSWTAINVGSIKNITTSYTLLPNDSGRILDFTSSANITLTVPNTLPLGFQVSVTQSGTGTITFVGSGGMVISNRYSGNETSGQWAKAGIEVRASNSAVLSGDIKI